ncbi:MAG: site-specific DNA-methyltransferase [Leptospiraceae bacterium]|nr:site-specific DNA-methyltransferase [Leptospiraceae bacterium]
MAKIDITRTELVWPGKYNDDGTLRETPKVNLPFQVIEQIGETRATKDAQKTKGLQLFDYSGKEGFTFEEGWHNKLIWGDNQLVMSSLLEKFAGKIDLIYIDPPFATGSDFSFTTEIGDNGETIEKEQSMLEEKAYRDTWGRGIESYIKMIQERFFLMHQLLSEKGTLYVHCDWHVNHVLRLILDEIFGQDNFINEIGWHYFGFKRKTAKNFPRKHDTIYSYSKSKNYLWEVQYKPHRPEYIARFKKDKDGRLYRDDVNPTAGGTRIIYLDQVPGDIVDSIWDDIPPVNPVATDRWNYQTQKPEALLERIIKASSNEGSLVADFFCGSGTTLAVAEKLGRRWIGADLGRYAIHTTRKRLQEIEDCKPFEVLNLGKYERQYWQSVEFGKKKAEQTYFEYLSFILKLYGADSISGMQYLHGRKGKAMVHIGSVDGPVTIDEIEKAIEECVRTKQSELQILAWDYEMGISTGESKTGLIQKIAKEKKVNLLLLQIPREVMEQQAVDKGDVRFFELAYMDVEFKPLKGKKLKVQLKDFIIPNTELIPEDVRKKIKKWSDYIDYWAVDWNFQNDTFIQGYVDYRTRKDRSLKLTSDDHQYEKSGKYRILVKVVDIFGNDTSQLFEVEVE